MMLAIAGYHATRLQTSTEQSMAAGGRLQRIAAPLDGHQPWRGLQDVTG